MPISIKTTKGRSLTGATVEDCWGLFFQIEHLTKLYVAPLL
jgi:hypothetical protein